MHCVNTLESISIAVLTLEVPEILALLGKMQDMGLNNKLSCLPEFLPLHAPKPSKILRGYLYYLYKRTYVTEILKKPPTV